MGSRRTIGRSISAVIGLILLAGCVPPPVMPWVGPERPVAEPVLGIPQSGGRPAVASGGGVTLAVWGGVSGARLDASGAVLDTGLRIASPPNADSPDVAFDGTNFLVVWQQTALRDVRGGIYGARVSPAGEVLDEIPFRISTTDRSTEPALAFDGTNHLVVWTAYDLAGYADVHGARVSSAGAVLDPSDLVISATAQWESEPAIAFTGANHLVLWSSSGDVLATRVTPAGVVLDPSGIPMTPAPSYKEAPDVTAVGDGYFAVWVNGPSNAQFTGIEGVRLDASGRPLDPAGIAIGRPDGTKAPTPPGTGRDPFARDQDPHLASDGTDILVTWDFSAGDEFEFGSVLSAARLDDRGAPVTDRIDLPMTYGSDVAFDGSNYVVAGGLGDPYDRDRGPTTLRGTRVNPGGAVLDPGGIQISLGTSSQWPFDLVSHGTSTFAVWDDNRDGPLGDDSGIYGGRMGSDGQPLDGNGIPISDGPGYGSSVAFDGTNYLVVWRSWESRQVMGARVSRDGIVLDRFVIANADWGPWPGAVVTHGPPTVAYGGGVFLVAWSHQSPDEFGPDGGTVDVARVSTDGRVLDPTAIEFYSGALAVPDIAYGDSAFMLVWTAYGTLLRAGVTTTGTVAVPAEPIATGAEAAAKIAWNGTNHLVVWGRAGDVFGTRLDDAGAVIDPGPIAIATAPGEQREPSVGANGPFLVTYTNWRREEGGAELVATRVDPDGRVVHPDGVTIATPVNAYGATGAIAPGRAPGTFEVAYGLLHDERPDNATRAYVRTVNPK